MISVDGLVFRADYILRWKVNDGGPNKNGKGRWGRCM